MANFTINESAKTSSGMAVKYLPTGAAYDAWASVYDSDGNVLCAMDDRRLETLLPQFVDDALLRCSGAETLRLADVGCGTGRNTLAVMGHLLRRGEAAGVEVTGIDLSEGMLDIARGKLDSWRALNSERGGILPAYSLKQLDVFSAVPSAEAGLALNSFDAIVSTLVLEHLPAKQYFSTLHSLLRPGGTALVTNMHSEMGKKAQAGFVTADAETGEAVKVRGESFAHTNAEIVAAAEGAGFEVVSAMEDAVTEDLLDVFGSRSRKWVGVNVWSGFWLKKIGP